MENELVIVTGHAGGIGAEIAKHIAQEGYQILGIDQRKSGEVECNEIIVDLEEIVDENNSTFEQKLKQALKGKILKSVINCAAVQIIQPFPNISTIDMKYSLSVNVLAPFRLTQLTLENLAKANGIVINIGSVHSRLSKKNFLSYSVSKAALSGLTRAMSIELGSEISVIEIQPAAISTSMLEAGFSDHPKQRRLLDEFHPTKKIGRPSDVAELCTLLVKYQIPFLNGSIINLDGGISHTLSDPGNIREN